MEPENDKTQTHVALTRGTMVSHYKIIERIGSGGMGEVYLAEDTKLHRKVALKFLPAHCTVVEEIKTRFIREAEAAASLNHPSIITIYEVSEYGGRPFFAMELVEGQSLREFAQGKELPIERIVDLAIQICDGLSAAHEKKVVHRDIKPSNILIDAYGRPKILDFGLAAIQGGEHLTKTGSTVGTVQYMSPEQTQGKEVDQRSDLFSLGVVLYEMIAGKSPFARDNDMATGQAIVNYAPEPLARYRSGVPDNLQAVVSKLLEKDPDLRYQYAAGVISDLKRLVRSAVSGEAISGSPPQRRFKLISVTAIALFAALIIVFGYFMLDQTRIPQKLGLAKSGKTKWTNSIAVLPFKDFSPNQDQEYFCDGMTDAIIGKLSGIENLKVISMTSVMRYKTPDRDLTKIGRDLRVKTILEGSIQREDSRIRIRSQLINVADDAHLWSDTYDRELASVFAIQDDISRAIVDAMQIELLGEDKTAITRRSTENLEAYDLYTRGRFLWNKRTERDLRKAIEYFERAIALDPNYALAYSGLADAWAIIPGYSGVNIEAVPLAEALPKAKQAAKKAIALDDKLAEAHASLGLVLWYEGDLEGAEKEYLRAIELNPGYAWAHHWYSLLLGDMARYQEQIREEEIAFELNPMSIPLITNRARRKTAFLEWPEAEELYKRLLEIEPNRARSHLDYAKLLAKMGRNEDAIRHCSLAVGLDDKEYNNVAYIYDLMGDFAKALWAANKYIESAPDNPNTYDTRGEIYANHGMLDSAIASFKKALKIKPDFATSLRNLGNVYLFRQEYTKAESLYQVLASHPDKNSRADGRLYLTQIPLHQGKLKEGLRMLDELADQAVADSLGGEHQAFGTYKRGCIYQDFLGDQESAIAEFEKVIKTLKDIEPNNWMVYFSRGDIALSYAKMGNLDRAEQLLQELESDIDKHGSWALNAYWQCVGSLEMEKGNFNNAAEYVEKLVQSYPVFWFRQMLGRCYVAAGRTSEAIAVLEKIINRFEQNRAYWPALSVTTHFWLGRAYEESGRYDEAITQYETFLDIWKNADPGLESIEDARARLAHLKKESQRNR